MASSFANKGQGSELSIVNSICDYISIGRYLYEDGDVGEPGRDSKVRNLTAAGDGGGRGLAGERSWWRARAVDWGCRGEGRAAAAAAAAA